MAPPCPASCNKAQEDNGKCVLLNAAYVLAGLSMMLNIRLSYSSAPYALIRFKLPENLFSVFVRRMASSLEIWCLPGFIIADIMEHAVKGVIGTDFSNFHTLESKQLKFNYIICPSIAAQWLNFLTYVILFFVYRGGGEEGHLTRFYWVIAISGFVFGISNPLVFAANYHYIPIYIAGENCFPALTSFIHYLTTLMFGNRRKWNSDYLIVYIDIWVAIIISFVAALVWTLGYGVFTSTNDDGAATGYGHIFADGFFGGTDAKPSMAACLLMILVGMGLVYAIYPGIAPGMIVPFYLIDKIEMILLIATAFPPVIIKILPEIDQRTNPYVLMGSWGVYHKKVCKGTGEPGRCGCPAPASTTGGTKITSVKLGISGNGLTHRITLNGNSGSTVTYTSDNTISLGGTTGTLTIKLPGGHAIKLKNLTISGGNQLTINGGSSRVSVLKKTNEWDPGEGTPINLNPTATLTTTTSQLTIDKQDSGGSTEATIGTSGQSVALDYSNGSGHITIQGTVFDELNAKFIADELHDSHKTKNCCIFSKQYTWQDYPPDAVYWNIFNILMPLQISLAAIFIYCLHYRDSAIARAIINQPKMSTALSIVFYMCHEILLAVGFPGIASDDHVLLPMQLIGAFLMVLLAFYSIGYITEYKRHDPSQWPTEGMTKWNAMCYWLKMASKLPIKIWHLVFTHYKGLILTRYYIHTTIDIHNIYYKLNII